MGRKYMVVQLMMYSQLYVLYHAYFFSEKKICYTDDVISYNLIQFTAEFTYMSIQQNQAKHQKTNQQKKVIKPDLYNRRIFYFSPSKYMGLTEERTSFPEVYVLHNLIFILFVFCFAYLFSCEDGHKKSVCEWFLLVDFN